MSSSSSTDSASFSSAQQHENEKFGLHLTSILNRILECSKLKETNFSVVIQGVYRRVDILGNECGGYTRYPIHPSSGYGLDTHFQSEMTTPSQFFPFVPVIFPSLRRCRPLFTSGYNAFLSCYLSTSTYLYIHTEILFFEQKISWRVLWGSIHSFLFILHYLLLI